MILKAAILGILEGVTEFLPISSTGHLILANQFIKFEGSFSNIFSIVIQMGAVLSVLLYFYKTLLPRSLRVEDVRDFFSVWIKVAVGVIPAATIGLLFEDEIDKYLFNPSVIALALIIGGLWILLVDSNNRGLARYNTMEDITIRLAFTIGLFQTLALIPGTSRSAMTIIGALLLGTNRKLAAEFSFYMSIPVLGGAGLLKLVKNAYAFSNEEWLALGVGIFVSFITSLLVIHLLMNFIKKHNFRPFAYYRLVLGALVLAAMVGGWI